MLPTSGTYNFLSVEIELLIREAYERLGILGEFTEYQKLDSAKRSIDFLLLDWMNKSVNLWTLQSSFLFLQPMRGEYTLPANVSDVIQVNLRTSTRLLNGTASSNIRLVDGVPAASSGVAANAFDGNPLTACTQNAPNGNISYDYVIFNQALTEIGIISQTTQNYTIDIESSADGAVWTPLLTIPIQQYPANISIQKIFDDPNDTFDRAFRMRETGGATLNIQEFYLVNYQPNANAAKAFDQDPTTAFIDILPNGFLIYDYGINSTEVVSFVGIQSNITTEYSLVVEYTLGDPGYLADPATTWTTLLNIPSQTYEKGIISWFDINIPVAARAYRIRETGGAILNLQEVYLNNNTYDLPISEVSRFEYNTFPNKNLQGRPSVYYLDRQIIPILNIWPTPGSGYNCLTYSYKKMMQDTGKFYTNTLEIPARLYNPLIWGLCWQLALKYKPELSAQFKAEYQESFIIATGEDSENTPVRIDFDYSNLES
jgi:hypothetical protein